MKIQSFLLPLFCSIAGVSVLTACSTWGGGINNDLREANNNFSYLNEVATERHLIQPSGTDKINFSKKFELPVQVKDSRAAIVGKDVDIRPPQKLIPLETNLIPFKDGDLSLVWFYPDDEGNAVTTNDMMFSILNLFKRLGIDVDSIDAINSEIRTDWYEATEFANPYTINSLKEDLLRYRQKYLFKLGTNKDGVPGVAIQLTDNIIEKSDGTELSDGLNRFEPSRFSALMANKLMWSYSLDTKSKLKKDDKGSVEISLGRDNNNLPCWIIDASFDETYNVLEQLFLRYDVDIKEYSSSNGEITVNYDEFDPDFWEAENVEPWGLDSGRYLFKLGVFNNKTSITLYDKNKQPVATGITARMYSGFTESLNKQFFIYKSDKTTNK